MLYYCVFAVYIVFLKIEKWNKYYWEKKVMFILHSIYRGIELWWVDHASRYENCELKNFENINFFGEKSSNWPNDLLETNVHKTFKLCW